MPRTAPAAVRLALVERAAAMLARREPVTLRSVVEGTGVSTMAVYTHFDGMPGLWRAVREEGFVRLAARVGDVATTTDPVRDLAALGAAYLAHAREHPDLYRAMFDTSVDPERPEVADPTFEALVAAAARARDAGRLLGTTNPQALAVQLWAAGHGLAMLALGGVLPMGELEEHARGVITSLVVGAGDDRARCVRSVRAGWRSEWS